MPPLGNAAWPVQVPFFGDQPFWGDCCFRSGVGPRPVPIGRLRTKDLLHAFEVFDTPDVQQAAAAMATKMEQDKGSQSAVQHFHRCASPVLLAQRVYIRTGQSCCFGQASLRFAGLGLQQQFVVTPGR